jgi:hypothetical protein
VYDPGLRGGPCLQCAWGDADYRTLEQQQPCEGVAGKGAAAAPTNAPAALGALAASLQVLEAKKWLAGSADRLPSGHEVLIDASSHRHLRSSIRTSARCRFDHATWEITRLDRGPDALTLGAALALPHAPGAARAPHALVAGALEVEGQRFATALTCGACGPDGAPMVPRLLAALGDDERRCPRCGGERVALGFELADSIDEGMLDGAALGLPLGAFGLRPGEVLSIAHPHGVAHYELANRPAGATAAGDASHRRHGEKRHG